MKYNGLRIHIEFKNADEYMHIDEFFKVNHLTSNNIEDLKKFIAAQISVMMQADRLNDISQSIDFLRKDRLPSNDSGYIDITKLPNK